MDLTKAIEALLHGPGEPMTGSAITNDEAREFGHATLNGAPFCLVRDWIWVDLEGPADQDKLFTRLGVEPVFLFAHTVVYDSLRRLDVGDFVRTSPLHKFTGGFVFQTKNTHYVLLGDGLRKQAHPKALALITG
jgi:hypothetical protein